MKTHGITRAIPAAALTLALALTPTASAASSTDTFKQAAQTDGYTTMDVSAHDCYTNIFNVLLRDEADVTSCAIAENSDNTFVVFYATLSETGMAQFADMSAKATDGSVSDYTRRADGGYNIAGTWWIDGNNILYVNENGGAASDKGAEFARQVGMPLTDGTANPSASASASESETASPSASASASQSAKASPSASATNATNDNGNDTTTANNHKPLLIGIGAGVLAIIIAIVTAVILSARKRKTRDTNPYGTDPYGGANTTSYGANPYGGTPTTPGAYSDPYGTPDTTQPTPDRGYAQNAQYPTSAPTTPAADPWNQNPQPVTYPTPDANGYGNTPTQANPSDSIWNQPTHTLPDTPRQNNTIYRN